MSSAINPLFPPASRRAVEFGVKFNSLIARWTALTLSGETCALPFITLETVALLTPASLATWSMVESVRFERFNKGASIASESSAGENGRNPAFICEELNISSNDRTRPVEV